jgi:fused signal recognition particle receptor
VVAGEVMCGAWWMCQFPRVLFVIGANGMGKTTTIGKICHRLKTEANQTVLVAACDTFR